MSKPDWWPKNPYPAEVFPLTMQAYADMVDEETRTAISGCLGRFFWQIASDQIFAAIPCALLEAPENDRAKILGEQPFGTSHWAGTWNGFPAISLSYYGGATLFYFDGEWKKKPFESLQELHKSINVDRA